MARIAGVDLPRDKRIEIALTYIYGIGLTTSKKLLAEGGINPDTRTRDLTEDEVESFHLSTLKLDFDAAAAEYERRACTPLGRLIANRELPVLTRAKALLDGEAEARG